MQKQGHQHRYKKGGFTHFASLPFIRKTHRNSINVIQDLIENVLGKCIESKKMRRASNKLMHLTLGMLSLPDNQIQARAVDIFDQLRKEFQNEMRQTSLTFSKIGYFTRFNRHFNLNQVTVIYLEPEKDKQLQKLKNVTDKIIRRMMEANIVSEKDFGRMHVSYNKDIQKFEINEYHLTLFRLESGALEDELFLQSMYDLKKIMNPLKVECDFIDISTRFHYDETKFYEPLTRIRLDSQIL